MKQRRNLPSQSTSKPFSARDMRFNVAPEASELYVGGTLVEAQPTASLGIYAYSGQTLGLMQVGARWVSEDDTHVLIETPPRMTGLSLGGKYYNLNLPWTYALVSTDAGARHFVREQMLHSPTDELRPFFFASDVTRHGVLSDDLLPSTNFHPDWHEKIDKRGGLAHFKSLDLQGVCDLAAEGPAAVTFEELTEMYAQTPDEDIPRFFPAFTHAMRQPKPKPRVGLPAREGMRYIIPSEAVQARWNEEFARHVPAANEMPAVERAIEETLRQRMQREDVRWELPDNWPPPQRND